MKTKILVIISFLTTLILNALAGSTSYIGGHDTKYISDMYPTAFTPSPYVFSIWGVIYILLVIYVIHYLLKGGSTKLANLFIISNVLNSIWIILWQNDYIYLSGILIIPFLITLLLAVKENFITNIELSWKYVARRVSFETYAAWLCVATIANLSIILKKIPQMPQIECIKAPCFATVKFLEISETNWAFIMVAIALLIAIYMTLKKKSWPFLAVILWATYSVITNNL